MTIDEIMTQKHRRETGRTLPTCGFDINRIKKKPSSDKVVLSSIIIMKATTSILLDVFAKSEYA